MIVLLRVFMAMLTTTFNAVNKDALLRWRLQYARHILQHELIAIRTGGSTKAGEQIDGQSFYTFRAYLDIDSAAAKPYSLRRLSTTTKASSLSGPSTGQALPMSTSPPERATVVSGSDHKLLA